MRLRVRNKKNASGSISIQIIDRKNRGYKVVETVGCATNEDKIEILYQKALDRIDELENNLLFISNVNRKKEQIEEYFLSTVTTDNFIPIGDELIFGRLFDEIGCNNLFKNLNLTNIRDKHKKDFLFKSLVISRILYPGSKLELIYYLEYFKKQTVDIYTIYRFLDTIYQDEVKHKIETCIFNHTKKIMNNSIMLTFYDATTLHFESESEDDLKG